MTNEMTIFYTSVVLFFVAPISIIAVGWAAAYFNDQRPDQ